jgi:predicted TIM-barrel fold metal-dependent hydrolase
VAQERVLVISTDTHIGPPLSELRQYCEASLLDEYDRFTESALRLDSFLGPGDLHVHPRVLEAFFNNLGPSHFDREQRLRDMDEQGIVTEVLFHGSQNGQPIPFLAMGMGGIPADDTNGFLLAAAGMRIYNRWLADYCMQEPARHVGLAQIPVWDLDLAVAEVEWAAEAGLRGINMPAPRSSLLPFNSREWDRFWSAVEASGLSLNTHAGSADVFLDGGGPEGTAIGTVELTVATRRSLWVMIFGGVFERHPGLNLVLAELPGLWAATLLDELDSIWRAPHHVIQTVIPEPPSFYFRRNCFITGSFMSQKEAGHMRDHDLGENYLWGSDYPHIESVHPHTLASMRMAFAGQTEDFIRNVAGRNAARIYGLPEDELAKVADRIGPTLDDLMEPFGSDQIPADMVCSLGFRQSGYWD